MTSKAMLIEKSKNTEELYQNIEDVIKNQKEKNALNNIQLEKLVQYELAETKDEKMIKDFIEKIRNAKGEDEIMTNASRIINNEMRKQRKAGIEEGKAEGKAEGRAIGRIAGIKENQEKVIRRLKLMNLSTQQIAKAVELEIKEVERILNEKQ